MIARRLRFVCQGDDRGPPQMSISPRLSYQAPSGVLPINPIIRSLPKWVLLGRI